MQTITSRQNPLCQQVRSLHQRKYRRQQGQFLIEGENAVKSALNAGWELVKVLSVPAHLSYWQKQLEVANSHLSLLQSIDEDVLQSICSTQTSPQVAAIGTMKSTFTETLWCTSKVLLVLDEISDPGNLGTLFRAADAAGADAVILTGEGADPFAPKVIRAAAGSIFHCPFQKMDSTELVAKAKDHGIPLVAADAHGGNDCFDFPWPRRAILVLGNEKRGISKVLSEGAQSVTIPVHGKAESLNVAMAGTLLLYAMK